MKKVLFFALAAGVALAACTKNEVRPVEVDQEITYQTISTKGTPSAMNEANHFISYAYFLEKGKSWDDDYKNASAYINAAEIYHHDNPNCWKAGSTYYWPKQGSLTFFAWSDNDNNPSVTPTPTCSIEKGIKVSPYDITANKNVDFLVAEIVKDQTKNTTEVGGKTWATGVPTVFKHTLSKLEFQVQTVDNNGNAKDYSSEDITFTVKSITLNSVKNKRNYAQTWRKDASGPVASDHVWSDTTVTVHIDVPVFHGNENVTKDATPLPKTDYEIVIPQEFENDDLLEIKYDITTSYTGSDVVEHVTQTVKLSDVYPSGWKVNMLYTLLIKLSVNEIYWAPTVEEWDKVTATEQTF